ncbi:MAG: 3-hydroxyacyl-CoA dehydrogenase NAD-binding domain-containing protein [Pseudomonadales bacterium]
MSYAQYEKDSDDIVLLSFNDPDSPVNVMNNNFINGLGEAIDRLASEVDDIAGVIVTSGKDTFFAGGDLEEIVAVDKSDVQRYFEKIMHIKSMFRRVERLGKPVVAAINGAALGGGYEICLACHHRVALDDKKVQIGLPEVTLGLLPGGGGVVRLVRLVGLKAALPLLMEGTRLRADQALQQGLIDQLAAGRDEMLLQAKSWIKSNPEPFQPWDWQDYTFPGGGLDAPGMSDFVTFAVADLQAKKRGLYPAPQAILSTAVESMRVDLDTADQIEARYLSYLSTTQVAKNMITTFFQMNKLRGGASRPEGYGKNKVSKIGILGAGMMGSGIAWCAALAGVEAVLKDDTLEAAERGKSYSDALASKRAPKGTMSEQEKENLLSLITPTANIEDLRGCELVIEAVFENRELKAAVTQEAEAQLDDKAIFASNTSTLPITGLAEASRTPENFIGLHFFSPVDRMELVEIICGTQTSDETLAKAYDFVRQIRKLPIVVNDSRDFYTSRVFESGCDEGAWLLSDGVEPALIENLAQQAGMPVGPLASVDAVSQQLVYAVKSQAKKDFEAGGILFRAGDEPPFVWTKRMVEEYDRRGKAYGAGYYEYPSGGKKTLWPELRKLQPEQSKDISHQDIKDRILFRQCVEAVRCLEEGVLRSIVDCNIGSMLGIGFPPYTGGQAQYINAYGVQAFAERAAELAAKYGDRFAPPQLLLDKAEKGEVFA